MDYECDRLIGLFVLGMVWDPKGRKRTVTREMPFDNLREELGGYDAPPS